MRFVLGAIAGLRLGAWLCGAAVADKAEPPVPDTQFLLGGDISMLARIEQCGGVFRHDGQARDAIRILQDHGCNCFRLRLFVNPSHENAVVNDLPYTLALARRIKAVGAKLLLDFHYSDTWADPAHQTRPAAWRGLPFPALVGKVEDYTASAVAELREAGALPDLVQIGNEITPGMLWPDGRVGGKFNTQKQWDQLAQLLKAGVRGVRKAQGGRRKVGIVIHIHPGGRWAVTKWFFDRILARGVPFDVIGLSFYPWFHGRMEDLRNNLRNTARAYGKDILVVETAYPYRGAPHWKRQKNMAWPISREGQRAFLRDVVKTVRDTPGGRGKGVLWWYPESIPVRGLRVWHGGATALFDTDGSLLPAADAFRQPGARK